MFAKFDKMLCLKSDVIFLGLSQMFEKMPNWTATPRNVVDFASKVSRSFLRVVVFPERKNTQRVLKYLRDSPTRAACAHTREHLRARGGELWPALNLPARPASRAQQGIFHRSTLREAFSTPKASLLLEIFWTKSEKSRKKNALSGHTRPPTKVPLCRKYIGERSGRCGGSSRSVWSSSRAWIPSTCTVPQQRRTRKWMYFGMSVFLG